MNVPWRWTPTPPTSGTPQINPLVNKSSAEDRSIPVNATYRYGRILNASGELNELSTTPGPGMLQVALTRNEIVELANAGEVSPQIAALLATETPQAKALRHYANQIIQDSRSKMSFRDEDPNASQMEADARSMANPVGFDKFQDLPDELTNSQYRTLAQQTFSKSGAVDRYYEEIASPDLPYRPVTERVRIKGSRAFLYNLSGAAQTGPMAVEDYTNPKSPVWDVDPKTYRGLGPLGFLGTNPGTSKLLAGYLGGLMKSQTINVRTGWQRTADESLDHLSGTPAIPPAAGGAGFMLGFLMQPDLAGGILSSVATRNPLPDQEAIAPPEVDPETPPIYNDPKGELRQYDEAAPQAETEALQRADANERYLQSLRALRIPRTSPAYSQRVAAFMLNLKGSTRGTLEWIASHDPEARAWQAAQWGSGMNAVRPLLASEARENMVASLQERLLNENDSMTPERAGLLARQMVASAGRVETQPEYIDRTRQDVISSVRTRLLLDGKAGSLQEATLMAEKIVASGGRIDAPLSTSKAAQTAPTRSANVQWARVTGPNGFVREGPLAQMQALARELSISTGKSHGLKPISAPANASQINPPVAQASVVAPRAGQVNEKGVRYREIMTNADAFLNDLPGSNGLKKVAVKNIQNATFAGYSPSDDKIALTTNFMDDEFMADNTYAQEFLGGGSAEENRRIVLAHELGHRVTHAGGNLLDASRQYLDALEETNPMAAKAMQNYVNQFPENHPYRTPEGRAQELAADVMASVYGHKPSRLGRRLGCGQRRFERTERCGSRGPGAVPNPSHGGGARALRRARAAAQFLGRPDPGVLGL